MFYISYKPFLHSGPIFTVQEGLSQKNKIFIKTCFPFGNTGNGTVLFIEYEKKLKNAIPSHLHLQLHQDIK
jgi:hypothetical protein